MITLTHEGDHWEFWIDPDGAPKTGMRIGSGTGILAAAEEATKYLDAGKARINECIIEFCQQRLPKSTKSTRWRDRQVRLTKLQSKRLETFVIYADQLANIAFNGSQSDNEVGARFRQTMGEVRQQYDDAKAEFRKSFRPFQKTKG